MSSRERPLTRSRSNRPSSRSPINSTQYFVERVNKVTARQLYETALKSKKKDTSTLLSHRSQFGTTSPFVKGKGEDSSICRTARSRCEKTCESALTTTRFKVRKVGFEFGVSKLAGLLKGRMTRGMAQLRRNLIYKDRHSHQCTDAQSTHFESQLSYHAKQESLSLASMLALTICPNCKHVGVSLLTSSTKEQLSPKFMQKVKGLLPSASEVVSARRETKAPSLLFATEMKDSTVLQASSLTLNKDEPPKESKDPPELSIVMYEDENAQMIPDISEIHMNPSSDSISMDSSPLESPKESARTATEKSPDFNNPSEARKNEISFELMQGWKKGESNLTEVPKGDSSISRPNIPIPRLNFSDLTTGGKYPIKIFDRKKLSSGKAGHYLKEKKSLGSAGSAGSVETSVGLGLERVGNVYKVRLQRAFDMVFLSRVRKETPEEPSMTFEFSQDELEVNFLAGTFGSKAGLFDEKEFSEPEVPPINIAAVTLLRSKLEKIMTRKKMQVWVRFCHFAT